MNKTFENPNFIRWFEGSKVVNTDGTPKVMYHGTARPERIGKAFLASRATSGPMSFFTDDPKIASNYATGKIDTSIDRGESYDDWFKVKLKGYRTPINIVDAYWRLDSSIRNKINEILPHVVNVDEEGNEIESYRIDKNMCGLMDCNGWQYEIRRARGNILKAAVEVWLNSAGLFNREEEFLKILKLAGMDNVLYEDPNARYSGVIPVYLSIKNPFKTSNIDEAIANKLIEVAKRKKGSKLKYSADPWDKRDLSGSDWIERFKADLENGTTHAWTSIPDWITDELKNMGYDGIKDQGGKYSQLEHAVWIPFYSNQIKSVYNKGTFNPASKNISENYFYRIYEGLSMRSFGNYPDDNAGATRFVREQIKPYSDKGNMEKVRELLKIVWAKLTGDLTYKSLYRMSASELKAYVDKASGKGLIL